LRRGARSHAGAASFPTPPLRVILSNLLSVPDTRRSDIERLAPVLRPGLRVALSTHINADGDGCGSGTALARLLAQRGLAPFIVNPTPWPAMYRFLLADDVVDRSADGAAALREADVLIVHDISDVKRLGALAETVRRLTIPKLVIDHHLPSDEPPSEITLSDTTACATGELVFDVASVLGLELTAAIARSLYAAILTDTGGFRFSNTSPRCHAIAAALLAAGVDPEEMYTRIYASAPIGRLQLLGEALETLAIDREHLDLRRVGSARAPRGAERRPRWNRRACPLSLRHAARPVLSRSRAW
jgi:phosphoesterase RecJ-like protein